MIGSLRPIDSRLAVWLCALAGLTAGVVLFSIRYPIDYVGLDFQAFWCGGKVLLTHANPYLNQPLHACEQMHSPVFFSRYANVTVPVPLPPYAIALLAPLSLIPYVLAVKIWWLILVGASLAAGFGISRMSGLPPLTAVAASFVAVAGPAIFPGALAPLPVALTIYAAVALKEERWNGAALLLGAAAIEPHMVLPVWVSVFLFAPHMRVRLAVVGAALFAVTMATTGPTILATYFTAVLPIHALAEVNNLAQYSLTAALYHLGVAPLLALRIGTLQYAAFFVLGIIAGNRLWKKSGNRAWLALAPSGFAVMGGAFIHLDQVAMVIPMACLLLAERPSALRSAIVVLLAAPFEILINWLPFCVPGTLAGGWLLSQTRLRWQAVIGIGIGELLFAYWLPAFLLSGAHYVPPVIHIADPGPHAVASVSWAAFMSYASVRPSIWWTEKLLTDVPVAVLFCVILREAFAKSRSVATYGGIAGAALRTSL